MDDSELYDFEKINHPVVGEHRITSRVCPEQYEGKFVTGEYFYFRYRWGIASLAVRDSEDEARGMEDVTIKYGDSHDGMFASFVARDKVFSALLAKLLADSVR